MSFADSHWTNVSKEAKDLVTRLVAKDPQERVTAREALSHSWFSLEHADSCLLSSALENMKKYHNKQNEHRFNVEKIKPEFSTVTCTPLLNSRFSGAGVQDSPLVLPRTPGKTPPGSPPRKPETKEEKKVVTSLPNGLGTDGGSGNAQYRP